MKRLSVFIALIAAFVLSSCGFNTMQQQEEEVFKAWGDLESALQRRMDLVPNLVATVKGYATHEAATLEKIVELRGQVAGASMRGTTINDGAALAKYSKAQNELSAGIGRLLVIAEQYPDLKANENFRDLQSQLEGTENRINVARTRYNEAVSTFNGSIRGFPNNMINGWLLHLEKKEYFKADEKAKEVPKVQF